MTPVQAFYSINEAYRPAAERMYHNNDACRVGRAIPPRDRRSGTNNYPQCGECARLTRHPQPADPRAATD